MSKALRSRLSSARTSEIDESAQHHLRKRDELRRNADTSNVAGLWRGATSYMPFEAKPPTPFWVPDNIPIDEEEARRLFRAFDDDLSHSLDREEMTLILTALGMSGSDTNAALQMMYENHDSVDSDMFRLWLKRYDFIERPVCFKEKIFLLLSDAQSSRAGGYVAYGIVISIIASVFTYMLESLPSLKTYPDGCHGCEPILTSDSKWYFVNSERIIITIFTVDYLLRLFTAHASRQFIFKEANILDFYLTFQVIHDPEALSRQKSEVQQALNASALTKTIRFFFTPLNLIDLFSILPFFLEGLLKGGNGLLVLRILRLCRLFRLFKLKKYSAGFDVFLHTLGQSSEAITVLLFILALLLVFLGSLIYLAEGGSWYRPEDDCAGVPCSDNYPDGAYLRPTRDGSLELSPFSSIFDSCWFIMTTITTVGYGDMVSDTQWLIRLV